MLGHTRTHVAGTGWTLDLQCVAVVLVESLQTLNQEEVDSEPDRSSPVGVSAKLHRISPMPLVLYSHGGILTMPDLESPGQYPTPNSSPLTFIENGCSWWNNDILN